ncbi:hypothetical protein EV361DRAFT_878689 [Lentinula raphanica]|nr:hypothetical protein EV361DRAFT_878689 [Lentinula raphanica]
MRRSLSALITIFQRIYPALAMDPSPAKHTMLATTNSSHRMSISMACLPIFLRINFSSLRHLLVRSEACGVLLDTSERRKVVMVLYSSKP